MYSLSMHMYEILSYALSDSDIELSNLFMGLFYCRNPILLEAAAETNFFSENSSAYLSDDASDLQLSKFAELTEMCIIYSTDVNEYFSYIPKFLDFTYNDIVTLTILNLLKNEDDFTFVQLSMKSNNFVKKVVNKITDLRKCQIGGNRLGNLYRILVKCFQNDVLNKSCQCPSVIEVALDIHDDDQTCVLNPQWNLICEMCTSPSFKDHTTMIEYALSIIIPDDYEMFNEFNVFAIDFIAKSLENKPLEVKNIDVCLLSNTIVSIFKAFPNHAIALTSVVNLIIVLLSIEDSFDIVYNTVIPFLIKCIEKEDQKILCIYAINAIQKIVNLGESIDLMFLSDKFENDDDFVNICNSKIYNYEKKKRKSYGGNYRIIDQDSFDEVIPLKIPQTVE